MRNRLFHGVLSCLALGSPGCAESALDPNYGRDSGFEPVKRQPDAGEGDDGDDGDDSDDDAQASKDDAGRGRDAGRADGGSRDAGGSGGDDDAGSSSIDSGAPDAGVTAPKDAGAPAKDAGQPVVDSGQPVSCTGGNLQCGGSCVDTKTNNQHCGACGNACSNGQVCGDGKCASSVAVPSGCAAKKFDNHDYLFCTNERSWSDARRACIDAKMDLAVIGSNGESDFLKANGDSWFGANDVDDENDWVQPVLGNADSSNGAGLSFTRWGSGEPNNTQRCDGVDIFVGCLGRRSDEDCAIVRGADGQWNDVDCETNRRYVCESY